MAATKRVLYVEKRRRFAFVEFELAEIQRPCQHRPSCREEGVWSDNDSSKRFSGKTLEENEEEEGSEPPKAEMRPKGEPTAKKARSNPQVYMDIKIGNKPAGHIQMVAMTAGPGQQGREAAGEGDHLRLWGVHVRGAFSARPLRVQDSAAPGDPAPVRRVCVVALLGVSLEHSSPSMAWPPCGSFPSMAMGPGAHTGATSPPWMAVRGLPRPLLPRPLLGPPGWLLGISSGKILPSSCTASCLPGPLLLHLPRLSLRTHPPGEQSSRGQSRCKVPLSSLALVPHRLCFCPHTCWSESAGPRNRSQGPIHLFIQSQSQWSELYYRRVSRALLLPGTVLGAGDI